MKVFVTRDPDIRAALLPLLRDRFPDALHDLILEEFGCNGARIDIAVINGALHGYEIKSDSDSLDRLKSQIDEYGGVFDYMTLVCGKHLLAAAKTQIPKWWGIKLAYVVKGTVRVRDLRRERKNPGQKREALARMLWKNEAVRCLRRFGFKTVTTRHSIDDVWREASRLLDVSCLAEEARVAIKKRGGSGFVRLPIPNDDWCSTVSTVQQSHSSLNLDWLLSQQSRDLLHSSQE
jgi:hypothetical protein